MFFNSAYDQKDFLKILQTKICPDLVVDIKSMQFDRQTKYFVKDSIYQLWKIKFSDGTEVVLLEVEQTSINDPRITLTKDAFKILHDHHKENALIVFHSADTDSWRLSLLTSKYEGWDKINSNPKRYSFLLGSHEKVKTPNDYLIKKWTIKDFNDLISRFDVEVVRKEFFKQYLNLFLELYKELKLYEMSIGVENDIVTFTKTLMWKIIFLYFIQKKWRLWLEADKNRGSWKKDFIRFLFDDYKWERKLLKWEPKHSFYNDYLEPLFYEALSNERNSDLYERFGLKIPYLNWWLFEQEYDWKNTFVNPKDDIFENIIDIFDRYNFTIHEDDPYDREIAVDPEMLGKIFETMISVSKDNIQEICDMYEKAKAKSKDPDKIISVDVWKELNKKFGAFYTPREIVHYMTKESLTYYLINWIKEARSNESDDQIEKIIRELFRLKDEHLFKEEAKLSQEEFQLFEQYVILTKDLLKKVKVLDPAVGSWAFPMGILHEIFWLRRYLIDAFELKSETNYEIKKSIIQNNIYGVDIEPWAIDIARLRFWLSLVVDADKPEPLPNLDFKFVCANTLIPLEWWSLFTRQELIDELNNLRKQYFSTQKKSEKEALKKEFYKVQQELCGFAIKQHFNTRKEQKEYIESLVKQNTDPRNRQIMQWDPFDTKKSSDFFDSELMFGIGGFGVVIGNPPYLQIQKLSWQKIQEDYAKAWYKTFTRMWDLYCLFYELWIKLLVAWGNLCYITSNKRMRAWYWESMREYFVKNIDPKLLIDLWWGVFENATVDSNILLVEKKQVKEFNLKALDLIKETNVSNLYAFKDKFMTIKNLSQDSWTILSPIQDNIKIKIEKIWTPLKDWDIDIYRGLVTWDNNWLVLQKKSEIEEFINLDEKWEFIKKYIFGKDIFRYAYKIEKYLISIPKSTVFNIWNEFIQKLENRDTEFNNSISKRKEKWNYWYDLRGCSFYHIFNNPIIVWSDIVAIPSFAITDWETQVDTSAYFMNIQWSIFLKKYLLSILNSNLSYYYMNISASNLWSGALRRKKIFLEKLPIPKISSIEQQPFIDLVDKILEAKKNDPKADTSELERKIDLMVYELYGLSEEEVRVVEGK